MILFVSPPPVSRRRVGVGGWRCDMSLDCVLATIALPPTPSTRFARPTPRATGGGGTIAS
jgi:hypothetical protein